MKRFFLLALVVCAIPSAMHAQANKPTNFESLTAALDSPDLERRAIAVAKLRTADPSTIPEATRRKLIALLEREATATTPSREDDGEESLEGDYLTQLVRVVVRLNDPASARGLALAGLSINADAQRIVAARGDAAVPLLEEAERSDTSLVGPVAATRGRMLGDYAELLSAESRATIRAEILRMASDALAFERAVRFARLVETVPVLTKIADTSSSSLTKSIVGRTAQQLAALRDQSSPETIVDRLSASIAAICRDATGSRNGACESMQQLSRNALEHVRAARANAAHNVLLALATRADDAARQGALTPAEATMIAGTARYLTTRI